MSGRRKQVGVVVRRFPVAVLNDIVYAAAPMPMELAQTIRTLRREHRLAYEEVMLALCKSEPSRSECYGFGKALVELACQCLNDFDPNWK